MTELLELAHLLSSGNLRVSTGLWLLPFAYLGKEEEEARRLNLEPVDIRLYLQRILPEKTEFSNLSRELIFKLINNVSQESGDWAGAMIFNLDLLIAYLNSTDRNILWKELFIAMPHRSRGVILTIPETASNLLPDEESLSALRNDNRLVGTVRI
jgi:hypothetical protein